MSLGVIVGRFQTPYLHEGHLFLIESVLSKHEKILVVLGDNGGNPTSKYPLSYTVRAGMIRAVYSNTNQILIDRIYDVGCDKIWSRNLDEIINKYKNNEVILYGSRDSFIPYYSGQYKTQEIPVLRNHNATELRNKVIEEPLNNPSFRSGIIYSVATRFPICYQVVDIAVVNADKNVLMGYKKKDGGKFRFVGGFVDPLDLTLELAAYRELYEETTIFALDCQYIGSYRILDSRYRESKDAVMTAFFIVQAYAGTPIPRDDLEGVKWVAIDELLDVIVDNHRYLAKKLMEYMSIKEPTNV